ncbi:MAG: type II toxin-antitoxin system Phd/YefM family antitoxin [Vicinamibacterales bacterium]
MGKAVTAADANRYFSKLLRDVTGGETCLITSHGRPVARLVPIDDARSTRSAARSALLSRLRSEPATAPIGAWTRDDLYDGGDA